jgi:hypothetical protein
MGLPASRPQRERTLGTRTRLAEQLTDRDLQDFAEAIKKVDRWISPLTLETANVRAIDPGIGREPVLGETPDNSDPPQVPSHQLPSAHDATASG